MNQEYQNHPASAGVDPRAQPEGPGRFLAGPKAILSVVSRAKCKLGHYDRSPVGSIVEIRDPRCLSPTERSELLRRLTEFNFVIYQTRSNSSKKTDLGFLGLQLGIGRTDHNFCADDDDISSVQVCQQGDRPGYIPYTDRPLGWHTDGYYYGNRSGRVIRSFILHCVTPAPQGGENAFIDPDVVFLLLHEIDESLPVTLSNPSAFTIPPDSGQPVDRQFSRTGPVFSIDSDSRALHMRYTARRHNILWNPDPRITEAAKCLKEVIEQASRYTVTRKLESGQGVICNNVLHRRSGFVNGDSDAAQRLIYRARFYKRVPGTLPPG